MLSDDTNNRKNEGNKEPFILGYSEDIPNICDTNIFLGYNNNDIGVKSNQNICKEDSNMSEMVIRDDNHPIRTCCYFDTFYQNDSKSEIKYNVRSFLDDNINNDNNSKVHVIDDDYKTLTASTKTYMKIDRGVSLKFKPKEDITTFELAKCIEIIFYFLNRVYISETEVNFEEKYLRHFEIIKL